MFLLNSERVKFKKIQDVLFPAGDVLDDLHEVFCKD